MTNMASNSINNIEAASKRIGQEAGREGGGWLMLSLQWSKRREWQRRMKAL